MENCRSKQHRMTQRLHFDEACFMAVLVVWVTEMQGKAAPGSSGTRRLELPLQDCRGPCFACIDWCCLKLASVEVRLQLPAELLKTAFLNRACFISTGNREPFGYCSAFGAHHSRCSWQPGGERGSKELHWAQSWAYLIVLPSFNRPANFKRLYLPLNASCNSFCCSLSIWHDVLTGKKDPRFTKIWELARKSGFLSEKKRGRRYCRVLCSFVEVWSCVFLTCLNDAYGIFLHNWKCTERERERDREPFGSSFPICASHLSLAGRTHHYEPFRHFGKCVLVIKHGQPWAWSIFCAAASSRVASIPHLLPAAHRRMARYRGLVPVPKGWCWKEHGRSQVWAVFLLSSVQPFVAQMSLRLVWLMVYLAARSGFLLPDSPSQSVFSEQPATTWKQGINVHFGPACHGSLC